MALVSSEISASTRLDRHGEVAPIQSRHNIPALDGVRGIAILMVMLFHFAPVFRPHATLAGQVIFGTLRLGWTGVDLFFVLSGFLITGILLDSKESPRFFTNFYARRTLRIFPLYYGVLALVFLVAARLHHFSSTGMQGLIHHQGWLWSYNWNTFLSLSGKWSGDPTPLNFDQFWSLGVEEQFYLLWPLIIFLLSGRRLLTVLIATIIAPLLLRVWLWNRGAPAIWLDALTPCRLDTLACGALLAWIVRQRGGIQMVLPWARRLTPICGILIIAGLFHGDDDISTLRETIGYTIVALFYTGVIFFAVTLSSASLFNRSMVHPALRFFGKYSYGLYVFHALFQPLFLKFFGAEKLAPKLHSLPAAVAAQIILSTIASVAVAWASWNFYEQRFLRLKRYFSDPATRPVAAGPTILPQPE